MTRLLMNRYVMMQSVLFFLTSNLSLFSDKPAILATIAKLKSQIEEMESIIQQQAIGTAADYEIKSDNKDGIIDTALKVVAGMAALASINGDTRLRMDADVTLTDLTKARDTDFVTKIRAIHAAALLWAEDLVVWNVALTDIQNLKIFIDDFALQGPSVRNVKVKTVQATREIKAKVDETSALLNNNLDAMMMTYKTINPTFHGQYLTARIIIDVAAGHTPAAE